MAPVPVQIGDQHFLTQAAAKAHVSKLLSALGATSNVERDSPDTYVFLLHLINGHHDARKKLTNLVSLSLRPAGNDSYTIIIRYADGHKDDVSWDKSITGAASTPSRKLAFAYRQAVQSQTDGFKAAAPLPCPCAHCTITLATRQAMQVDHIIQFRDLITAFVEGSAIAVPDLVMSDQSCRTKHRFHDVDHVFKASWAAYHQQHATLQITCATCNLVTLPALRAAGNPVPL